ncbi:hypothetical protein GYA93_10735 [Gordonia desulfuricans]|uniref:Uncharacterized protein n=1 Tax=Gordonia desulfuricans TaxID=89051 RepID=A0A7K3LP94_9ACTN|nr:hypothetical protein [Gordonia desulfuricans]NDK90053.1 hypothetical protein [Gordonia desulfuricans]
MNKKLSTVVAAATLSAGVLLASVGVGDAHAWVHSVGHAGSGQIVAGKIVISYHNSLTRDIHCAYTIGTAETSSALHQAADKVNSAFQKLDADDEDGYRQDFTAGWGLIAEQHVSGKLLHLGDVSVSPTVITPGKTETVTFTPEGPIAAQYAGLVQCQELDTANGNPAPSDRTTRVKYDQDLGAFDITAAPSGGGNGDTSGAWGSLEDLLP